jgi:hypothetical protein
MPKELKPGILRSKGLAKAQSVEAAGQPKTQSVEAVGSPKGVANVAASGLSLSKGAQEAAKLVPKQGSMKLEFNAPSRLGPNTAFPQKVMQGPDSHGSGSVFSRFEGQQAADPGHIKSKGTKTPNTSVTTGDKFKKKNTNGPPVEPKQKPKPKPKPKPNPKEPGGNENPGIDEKQVAVTTPRLSITGDPNAKSVTHVNVDASEVIKATLTVVEHAAALRSQAREKKPSVVVASNNKLSAAINKATNKIRKGAATTQTSTQLVKNNVSGDAASISEIVSVKKTQLRPKNTSVIEEGTVEKGRAIFENLINQSFKKNNKFTKKNSSRVITNDPTHKGKEQANAKRTTVNTSTSTSTSTVELSPEKRRNAEAATGQGAKSNAADPMAELPHMSGIRQAAKEVGTPRSDIFVVAQVTPKAVAKKEKQRLLENIKKQKKNERKIRLIEEAANKGESFLSKVLGGFGFDTAIKDPQHILEELRKSNEGLSRKIEADENTIAKKEKRANANAEIQRQKLVTNLISEQKAIMEIKGYQEEAPQQKRTINNAIKEGFLSKPENINAAIQKKTKRQTSAKIEKNITKRTNKNSASIGNNLFRLFNTNTKRENAPKANTLK